MNEAFVILERAKRDALARLARYEQEGKASAHKLPSVRHALRDVEQALYWLKWANDTRLVFVRLWQHVEEGNITSVQVHSSRKQSRRSKGRK